MGLIAVKLLLAPAFVTGVSLAARRFGPTIGGVLAGLPVIAGPILLVYALQHGRPFAADAAAGTVLGMLPLTLFVVVYARLAQRRAWPACVVAGWIAFALLTVLLDGLTVSRGVALALALVGFGLGARALPRRLERALDAQPPPRWDLPARAACAAALVLALTALAGSLGPRLSGLLAAFPIITPILAAFTHDRYGRAAATRLLRGMLGGFVAFALFCATLAVSLTALGVAAAFTLAIAITLAVQAGAVALGRRAVV